MVDLHHILDQAGVLEVYANMTSYEDWESYRYVASDERTPQQGPYERNGRPA